MGLIPAYDRDLTAENVIKIQVEFDKLLDLVSRYDEERRLFHSTALDLIHTLKWESEIPNDVY